MYSRSLVDRVFDWKKVLLERISDLLIRFLLSGFLHQSNQPDLHLLQPFHLFISNIPLLHFQHLGISCFALISHFRSFSNIHFCTYLPNLFSTQILPPAKWHLTPLGGVTLLLIFFQTWLCLTLMHLMHPVTCWRCSFGLQSMSKAELCSAPDAERLRQRGTEFIDSREWVRECNSPAPDWWGEQVQTVHEVQRTLFLLFPKTLIWISSLTWEQTRILLCKIFNNNNNNYYYYYSLWQIAFIPLFIQV